MVNIQLRTVPKELNKKIARYKIDHELKNKAEAIIKIVTEALRGQK